MPGTKPARVKAAASASASASAAAAAAAAAGPGLRPLLTDPALQLCFLQEVTARLLAEARSCLVSSSFAGAEAEAIGSDLLRRPRGRATHARHSEDVCLSLSLFRAHNTKYCKNVQNTENKTENKMIRHSRKSTRGQGPTNRSTYQR